MTAENYYASILTDKFIYDVKFKWPTTFKQIEWHNSQILILRAVLLLGQLLLSLVYHLYIQLLSYCIGFEICWFVWTTTISLCVLCVIQYILLYCTVSKHSLSVIDLYNIWYMDCIMHYILNWDLYTNRYLMVSAANSRLRWLLIMNPCMYIEDYQFYTESFWKARQFGLFCHGSYGSAWDFIYMTGWKSISREITHSCSCCYNQNVNIEVHFSSPNLLFVFKGAL